MTYNYEDCSKFIKQELRVHLYPYQWQMIEAFCEGKKVQSARGIGRSFAAEVFGKYVASLHDKNDYNVVPDVVLPYTCATRCGVLPPNFIERVKQSVPKDVFRREYLCV